MSEDYDALGRRVPWGIEGGRRRWAVAVGRVAEEILSQRYGSKPSQESIRQYVEAVKGTPEGIRVLNKRANLMISGEFKKEVEGFVGGGMNLSDARRKANQLLEERYQKVEENPQENFSFLDPILFPGEETGGK
jgi:hypothetical protein